MGARADAAAGATGGWFEAGTLEPVQAPATPEHQYGVLHIWLLE